MSYDKWKTRSPDDESGMQQNESLSGEPLLNELERILERYVVDRDDHETLIANLQRLGFSGDDLIHNIEHAIRLRLIYH